jgi:diguanylate cyclase
MSQATLQQDWRRKYFDSIRAIEEEARQHRVRLQVLYRLAGRLCSAAHGQSSRLDAHLKLLREALRREAEPGELDALGESLAEAVRDIEEAAGRGATDATLGDAVHVRGGDAPAREHAPAGGEPRLREVLVRLLADLRREPEFLTCVDALQSDIQPAPTDEQLVGAFEQVGGWLLERIRHLQDERNGLTVLLDQMVGQLDALNNYVRSNAEEESRRHTSHDALNLQVTGEVRAMSETVMNGNDLESLRTHLTDRLAAIGKFMQDFKDREEDHARRSRERAARMQARMSEMEHEAKQLQARLSDEQRQSLIDGLTRIPNRAAWDQRIGREIAAWQQNGQPTCVLTWDVDHFKSINDRYGHRAGDKVLVVVAESLAAGIRGTDFVARYGGEEFAMVLPGTSLANGVVVANQIREAIAGTGFHFRGTPVAVTISCGITELQEGDDAGEVFDRADQALYRAKNGGRNKVSGA